MASPFTVSPTTTTVALDQASRRAQVVLSVANSSGRALRGRGLVKAQDTAAQPWFTIVGEIERPFAVAETHQWTIQVAVPLTAAAGTYLFRLDLVAEDRPNEDYTQGPSIALTVPAAVAPPRFPWWPIAVAAAAVLLLVGTIVVLLARGGGETATMPNVVGKPRPEAEKLLADAGLKVATIIRDSTPTGTPDTVLDQEPPPGTATPRANGVTLVLEAQVRAKETLQLRDREEGDLDSGRVGASAEADLQLEMFVTSGFPPPGQPPLFFVTGGALNARNGARFAKVGTAFVGLRACDAALKASSVTSIPLADLPRGTRVCVLTSERRVALFHIDQAVTLNRGLPTVLPLGGPFITWIP